MYFVSAASTANGRGQKRDNTKQTTLFGLPAVSAPEKPEKRARKKGGAVPCESDRGASPGSRESQDVEMAESQSAVVPTSQTATVVDSQQESQATEVITTQVKGTSHRHAALGADTIILRKRAVLSRLTGLHRHHRWDKVCRMRYPLIECLYCLHRVFYYVSNTSTHNLSCIYTLILGHRENMILLIPLVGYE